MSATSLSISVASEHSSRSAFIWTIFVSFIITTVKICGNVLLNLKWIDVTVSLELLGGAWWTGGWGLVFGGALMLSLRC